MPPRAEFVPRLQFRLVADPGDKSDADEMVDPDNRDPLRVLKKIEFDERDVVFADETVVDGNPIVTVAFNAKALHKLTAGRATLRLAMVLDGKLVSAPTMLLSSGDGPHVVIRGHTLAIPETPAEVENAITLDTYQLGWIPEYASSIVKIVGRSLADVDTGVSDVPTAGARQAPDTQPADALRAENERLRKELSVATREQMWRIGTLALAYGREHKRWPAKPSDLKDASNGDWALFIPPYQASNELLNELQHRQDVWDCVDTISAFVFYDDPFGEESHNSVVFQERFEFNPGLRWQFIDDGHLELEKTRRSIPAAKPLIPKAQTGPAAPQPGLR
jgi:hypothetical protein